MQSVIAQKSHFVILISLKSFLQLAVAVNFFLGSTCVHRTPFEALISRSHCCGTHSFIVSIFYTCTLKTTKTNNMVYLSQVFDCLCFPNTIRTHREPTLVRPQCHGQSQEAPLG